MRTVLGLALVAVMAWWVWVVRRHIRLDHRHDR